VVRSGTAGGAQFSSSSRQVGQGSLRHFGDLAIAALVCAPVCGLGFGQRTPLLQQYSQIERTGCVAPLVGAPVCGLGFGRNAALLEQHTEI
jgi:hypothetical protein